MWLSEQVPQRRHRRPTKAAMFLYASSMLGEIYARMDLPHVFTTPSSSMRISFVPPLFFHPPSTHWSVVAEHLHIIDFFPLQLIRL